MPALQRKTRIWYNARIEILDGSDPIIAAALGTVAGVTLVAFSRIARSLREPVRGLLRLEWGDVSFTEVIGMFVVGYSVATLISGSPAPSSSSGPQRPPIGGGRFIGGGFNPLARAGLPVATGMLLAFLTVLYRVDIIGRLTNPQSHNAVTAIIGAEAEAVEEIPAGGTGQIRFRDPTGNLVGVMASAEVHISRGSRVRIVGTKGLNPLIVPAAPQT